MSQGIVPTRLYSDDVAIVFLSFIVLIGVVLNSALLSKLLTASKQPTVRTSFSAGPYQLNSFSLFKLNLCIADFMILLIYALGKIVWLVNYDWRFGDTACKMYKFFSAMSFYASSNIIVNIALDRLKQVYNKRPQGAASVRRVRCMLVTSWVLAILCSIPQLFVWGTQTIDTDWHQCVSIFQYQVHINASTPAMDTVALIYELGHQATVFWIPFAMTLVSYVIIVLRLLVKHHLPVRKNTVRLNRSSESESRTETSLLGRIRDPKVKKISVIALNQEKKRKDVQREYSAAAWRSQLRSRVFRNAMAIVFAHLVIWLPYNLISLLRFVNFDWFAKASEGYLSLLLNLIVFNSLLNPLIYGSSPSRRGNLRF